jgi:hypothetical protein
MSGRKHDVIPQNGDCSRESNVSALVFRKKKSPLSKRNVVTELNMERIHIHIILKQFQETGNRLHRKGAGRLSTYQEDVDRIQEAWTF